MLQIDVWAFASFFLQMCFSIFCFVFCRFFQYLRTRKNTMVL